MKFLTYKNIICCIPLCIMGVLFTSNILADTNDPLLKKSRDVNTEYSLNLVKVKITSEVFTTKSLTLSLLDDPYNAIIPKYKDELSQQGRFSNKLAILYLDYQILNLDEDTTVLPTYESSPKIDEKYLEKKYNYYTLNGKRRVLVGYITPPQLGTNDISNFQTFKLQNVPVYVTQAFIGKDSKGNNLYPHLNNVYDRISMMQYLNFEAKNHNTEFIGMLEILDLDTNAITYVALPGNQKKFLETFQIKVEDTNNNQR